MTDAGRSQATDRLVVERYAQLVALNGHQQFVPLSDFRAMSKRLLLADQRLLLLVGQILLGLAPVRMSNRMLPVFKSCNCTSFALTFATNK